jgi:hypothetical protein
MSLVPALPGRNREQPIDPSLALYIAETAPSSFELRFRKRWPLLALLALATHLLVLWLAPTYRMPTTLAPVEIMDVDPAKLEAIKRQWDKKGFVLSKDPTAAKDDTPPPENARYESDRNRRVERETRAEKTTVIPNPATGSPQGATAPRERKIPLSNLSNFNGLPLPGRTPEESAALAARGHAGESGDQALMDDMLPVGAENMLNTTESVYYTFYSRIYEQIGPLWQSRVREVARSLRLPPGDYITRAEITFDSDGYYLETRIFQSSTRHELDQAVHDSWRRIPRFPNPPQGLIQSDGKIHMGWTFRVTIDEGMRWQYAPPRRSF